MDVLSTFGELDEEMSEKRKYAKWKAAYIHNCLKVGEKPTPGSFGNSQSEFTPIDDEETKPSNELHFNDGFQMPTFPSPPDSDNVSNVSNNMPPGGFNVPINSPINPMPPADPNYGNFAPPAYTPTPQPVVPNIPAPAPTVISTSFGGVTLSPDQIQKAQKYCKWATSALNYDDVKTATENLQKALTLLQTGRDVE